MFLILFCGGFFFPKVAEFVEMLYAIVSKDYLSLFWQLKRK